MKLFSPDSSFSSAVSSFPLDRRLLVLLAAFPPLPLPLLAVVGVFVLAAAVF